MASSNPFYEPDELVTPPEIKPPKFLPNNDVATNEITLGYSSSGSITAGTSTTSTPIFSKRKMNARIPATYTGNITHLAVSKNWMVCLLATVEQTTMLRFFLPRAKPPGEIQLERYLAGYKISKIFLDPTGHHLLISLIPKTPGLSADFLYIHGNGPKVRRIEKFKDHEITAVAFNNYFGTESSTAAILLGTNRGLIFETELTQEADKPSYRKQVYDLGVGRPKYPITALEVLRLSNTHKYNVIATAPDCIYTFQEILKTEDKSWQPIFAGYVNGVKEPIEEIVKTDLNYSVLRFYAPPNEKYPKQWGWLCGAGLRFGEVSTDAHNTTAAVLLNEDVISLDFEERKHLSYEERRQNVPKTFVLTEFHALLLYPDHLTGICLLNKQVIYEEYFHEQLGKLLNIGKDQFTGAIYVYTDKMIFNINISNEERNIWQIYLSKGLYDMAEIYAAEHPEQLDAIWVKKAEVAFSNKQYDLAAIIYSQTEQVFEEICLKFVDLDDKHPIITYVKKRLDKVEQSAQHVLALVIWLTDLYLTQINFPGRSVNERQQWQQEFDKFMQDERVRQCTHDNRVTIQNLIAQHADPHNLSQFAIANGDYEEVIKLQLNAEKYSDALATLRKQKDVQLFYKYGPILMDEMPHETIDVLMMQGRSLDIAQLVPTLATIETPKHVEEVIRYLEYAINDLGETNLAVHNFLIRLYAEHRPKEVIKYLVKEGNEVSLIPYDINYALSICMEYNVHKACVYLQCMLGMWTAAVDLALTFDVQLAKQTASRPRDDETRHKLWLRIAHEDIKGTNDVKKALALLKECDLLSIEDLLPFFSDFEKIDDFKEPICDALKDYNKKIQELRHEMDESTKQAERVRKDLESVREHSIRIEAHETCTLCETFLLVKPFFIFVCGHKFHSDCLEKQVIPMLNSEKSRRLTLLKQQLDATLAQSLSAADHSVIQQQKTQKKREKIKEEIEEILATDCLYCGLMIDTIDQPLIDNWDQINIDWE